MSAHCMDACTRCPLQAITEVNDDRKNVYKIGFRGKAFKEVHARQCMQGYACKDAHARMCMQGSACKDVHGRQRMHNNECKAVHA